MQFKRYFFDSFFGSEPVDSALGKATNIIKEFLNQKSVNRFRPHDVLDLLQPLVPPQPQAESADQVFQNLIQPICLSEMGGIVLKRISKVRNGMETLCL